MFMQPCGVKDSITFTSSNLLNKPQGLLHISYSLEKSKGQQVLQNQHLTSYFQEKRIEKFNAVDLTIARQTKIFLTFQILNWQNLNPIDFQNLPSLELLIIINRNSSSLVNKDDNVGSCLYKNLLYSDNVKLFPNQKYKLKWPIIEGEKNSQLTALNIFVNSNDKENQSQLEKIMNKSQTFQHHLNNPTDRLIPFSLDPLSASWKFKDISDVNFCHSIALCRVIHKIETQVKLTFSHETSLNNRKRIQGCNGEGKSFKIDKSFILELESESVTNSVFNTFSPIPLKLEFEHLSGDSFLKFEHDLDSTYSLKKETQQAKITYSLQPTLSSYAGVDNPPKFSIHCLYLDSGGLPTPNSAYKVSIWAGEHLLLSKRLEKKIASFIHVPPSIANNFYYGIDFLPTDNPSLLKKAFRFIFNESSKQWELKQEKQSAIFAILPKKKIQKTSVSSTISEKNSQLNAEEHPFICLDPQELLPALFDI